jgi:hypothetical protein
MKGDAYLADTSALSYLDASKVDSPKGTLAELDLLSPEGHQLGNIVGVVIDAAARRARYLAVRTRGWLGRRRYLVALDEVAQFEGDRKALRLRADLRDVAVRNLDADTLREFSDDDLMAALFQPRVA